MLGNESILTVDYRVEEGVLYRYHSDVVERIVPWGREAGAWRFARGEWGPFVPEVDVASLEKAAGRGCGTRMPGWQRRFAACRFLIEHWPEEARDGVRGFPSAHWQLLQLVNRGGAAALELLRSNAALGYLAALADAGDQVGVRRRALAALFGFPETEHAVRLLGKVPRAWVSSEFLAQLRAAMTEDRDADAVITHLARINPIALEVARDPELRASVAGDCMARLSRVAAPVAQCDLIARLRDLVDTARGQALPPPRIRGLRDLDRPAGAGTGDPVRARRAEPFALPAPRAREDGRPRVPPPPPIRTLPELVDRPVCAGRAQSPSSQRRKSGGEFPAPPLRDLDAGRVRISAIRTRADLVAESDAMHHCAGRDKSYARRVAAGRLYFYRMITPERLTIAIRPSGGWWTVEEVRGIHNQRPCETASALILKWVRESRESAGSKVLGQATPPRRRLGNANQLDFEFGG
jgi:hypothetical protein